VQPKAQPGFAVTVAGRATGMADDDGARPGRGRSLAYGRRPAAARALTDLQRAVIVPLARRRA